MSIPLEVPYDLGFFSCSSCGEIVPIGTTHICLFGGMVVLGLKERRTAMRMYRGNGGGCNGGGDGAGDCDCGGGAHQ